MNQGRRYIRGGFTGSTSSRNYEKIFLISLFTVTPPKSQWWCAALITFAPKCTISKQKFLNFHHPARGVRPLDFPPSPILNSHKWNLWLGPCYEQNVTKSLRAFIAYVIIINVINFFFFSLIQSFFLSFFSKLALPMHRWCTPAWGVGHRKFSQLSFGGYLQSPTFLRLSSCKNTF